MAESKNDSNLEFVFEKSPLTSLRVTVVQECGNGVSTDELPSPFPCPHHDWLESLVGLRDC